MKMDIFSEILKKLGPIKNELMVFVIVTAFIIHLVGWQLVNNKEEQWIRICGVAVHGVEVILLVGFTTFYCYALFKLPSSYQELLFSQSAQRTLSAHTRRGVRP